LIGFGPLRKTGDMGEQVAAMALDDALRGYERLLANFARVVVLRELGGESGADVTEVVLSVNLGWRCGNRLLAIGNRVQALGS
jgi:hypothetical protein